MREIIQSEYSISTGSYVVGHVHVNKFVQLFNSQATIEEIDNGSRGKVILYELDPKLSPSLLP
jgi:hypothetical protein